MRCKLNYNASVINLGDEIDVTSYVCLIQLAVGLTREIPPP